MVPLADLFDHDDSTHQVQLNVDEWVCGVCGKLWECEHDDEIGTGGHGKAKLNQVAEEEEQTVEMVTARPILPGDGVYNTYGSLSNAALLSSYGFILDSNDNDRITFDWEDVVEKKQEEQIRLQEVWTEVLHQWVSEEGNVDDNGDENQDEEDLVEPLSISLSWTKQFASSRPTKYASSSPLYINSDAQISLPLFILLGISAIPLETVITTDTIRLLRSVLLHTSSQPSTTTDSNLKNAISQSLLNLLSRRRNKTRLPVETGEEIFTLSEVRSFRHLFYLSHF